MNTQPPTSTSILGHAHAEPARRPGPSLKLSLGLLALSVVAGIPLIVMTVRGVGQGLTSPIRRTPVEFTLDAKQATYAVYERTGSTTSVGSATFSQNHSGVLTPRDVTVTGPGGQVVATRQPGNVTETLSRGSAQFTATVRFSTPSSGRYSVRIGGPPTDVVVARALGDSFRAALGWVLGAIAASLLFVLAIVLLIVGAVRRNGADNRAALAASAPYGGYAPVAYPPAAYPPAGFGAPAAPVATPPGWYADPWNPSLLRYYDGQTWTGHTHPGQG